MKTIYEYAVEYCGDPASHEQRGELIFGELCNLGLRSDSRVLNVGCGALSEGAPLIRHLDVGNYTGLDPNGWLIRAALDHDPGLAAHQPKWSFASDFDAAGGPFDFVVSHSVLSHVAHWQLELALSNVRKNVEQGALWLASLRFDQYDSFDKEWVYPGNSYFRQQTVIAIAAYFGWQMEGRGAFRERMVEICPNDIHDWVLFRATPSSAELNEWRLEAERARRESEEREAAELVEQRRLEQVRLAELEANAQ